MKKPFKKRVRKYNHPNYKSGYRIRKITKRNIDDKYILQNFGKNLYRIRRKKKLSQNDIAYKTNISLSLIQKYESDNPPNIKLTNLVRLIKGLRITLSDLLR